MSQRLAVLKLYERRNPDHLPVMDGWSDTTLAVCTLNQVFLAFTVGVYEPLLWGKPDYILRIRLPSTNTGRECGVKHFTTYEAALEYGKDFVTKLFPPVDEAVQPVYHTST